MQLRATHGRDAITTYAAIKWLQKPPCDSSDVTSAVSGIRFISQGYLTHDRREDTRTGQNCAFCQQFHAVLRTSPHRKDRFRSSDTSSPSSGRLKTPSHPLRGLFRTSSSSGICVINVTYDSHAPSLDKNTIICARVAETISTNDERWRHLQEFDLMSGASRVQKRIFISPNPFT